MAEPLTEETCRPVYEAQTKLVRATEDGRIMWGSDVRGIARPLVDCSWHYLHTVRKYFRGSSDPEWKEHWRAQGKWDEIERDVAGVENKASPDAFTTRLRDAVAKIEEFARPHLRA